MEVRRKWADSDSEDEEEYERPSVEENVITSLPSLETHNKPKQKKKAKVAKHEPEEKIDPNLVTKLSNNDSKPETNVVLRPDGTTASKKERKEKEMEELNKLLEEFGTGGVEEKPAEEGKTQKNEGKTGKNNKPKVSKKEIFENVRSEIVARTEKSKKGKKKNKFNNF